MTNAFRLLSPRPLAPRTTLLLAAVVLGAVVAFGPFVSPVQSAPAIALKSTSVELPNGDETLPKGPGLETVTNNCSGCHSAGMILNQPPLTKAVWDAEVKKMITVYKAPVEAKDVDTIVDYLVATHGAK